MADAHLTLPAPAEVSLQFATWLIGQMLELLESWEPLAPNPKLEAIEWAAKEWLADPTTQPPRPGTAPLSDEQADEAIRATGLDYLADAHDTNRAMLRKLCRAAAGHPTTPTPKDPA